MQSTKYNSGHFVLEAYYDSSWHMFDPDEEPDMLLLRKLGRPSVEQIAKDTNLLYRLYYNKPLVAADLMKSIKYGEVNELMPAKAYLFQVVSKHMSRFFWIVVILLIFIRKLRVVFLTKEYGASIFRKQK